jgi:hypothetical protein
MDRRAHEDVDPQVVHVFAQYAVLLMPPSLPKSDVPPSALLFIVSPALAV